MTSQSPKQDQSPSPSEAVLETLPRIDRDRDARVREYVAANTATPELARTELQAMGIIDDKGNLIKPYR